MYTPAKERYNIMEYNITAVEEADYCFPRFRLAYGIISEMLPIMKI